MDHKSHGQLKWNCPVLGHLYLSVNVEKNVEFLSGEEREKFVRRQSLNEVILQFDSFLKTRLFPSCFIVFFSPLNSAFIVQYK